MSSGSNANERSGGGNPIQCGAECLAHSLCELGNVPALYVAAGRKVCARLRYIYIYTSLRQLFNLSLYWFLLKFVILL